jgi:hypothetical protein
MRPNFRSAGKGLDGIGYLVGALTTVTLADPEPLLPLPPKVEVMLHLDTEKIQYQTGNSATKVCDDGVWFEK